MAGLDDPQKEASDVLSYHKLQSWPASRFKWSHWQDIGLYIWQIKYVRFYCSYKLHKNMIIMFLQCVLFLLLITSSVVSFTKTKYRPNDKYRIIKFLRIILDGEKIFKNRDIFKITRFLRMNERCCFRKMLIIFSREPVKTR